MIILSEVTLSGSKGGYKSTQVSHAISFIPVSLFSLTELPEDKAA